MKDKLKEIEKITKDFINQLGWEAEIKTEITEKIIYLRIETEDPQLLIGRRGEVLSAIQHILRLIINKNIGESVNLILDINDYKEKQRIFLETDSRKKAEYVKKTEKEIVMRPMNSFERRIVHLALRDIEGIVAESEGEGKERRIVIRPAE